MTIHELLKYHPNLTSGEVLIFQLICEKIQVNGNFSLYHIADLCNVSGLSDKTVRRAIETLAEEGLLIVNRSGKSNRYSLPANGEPPRPPRRKVKREESVPVSDTVNGSPNKISKNIIPFGSSDRSDKPKTDTVSPDSYHDDVQERPDPFTDPVFSKLPLDAVKVVRREYERLRSWYGRQPIRIGGVARQPADVRRRMRELTIEHIVQVIRAFADGRIHNAVCGVQTALYNAPSFQQNVASVAINAGQTAAPDLPTVSTYKPLHKSRNLFSNFEQRSYDYDAIERQLEDHLLQSIKTPHLIGRSWNEDLLKERPHTIIADLAVTYHILIGNNRDTTASAVITNRMMEIWGTTVEELHKLALRNMTTILPSEFVSMNEIMQRIIGEEADEMLPMDGQMYVLSNSTKVHGASALLDKKMMDEVVDKIGDGFYVLPSSVHEVICLKMCEEATPEKLSAMVRDINCSQVARDEWLSDHAYRYTRAEGLCVA